MALNNRDFWLVDQNPFALPEPAKWWQQLVKTYDKFLRLMPSQTERAYRLCRIAGRDSRLGLKLVGDIHRHPDTVAMIKFGVVPELTLSPAAIASNQIVGLLRSRDTWLQFGGDAEKRVDAIEKAEASEEATMLQEHAAQTDEVLTDSFRHLKYGYRETVQARLPTGLLKPLPPLPATLPASFLRSPLDI